MPGHLFVVQGDVRKIASAAWLLPCDVHGTVSPGWLDDEPELRERVDQFRSEAIDAFEKGIRVARLPGVRASTRVDGRHRRLPRDAGRVVRRRSSGVVAKATEELPDASPRLIATPFVGAGLGGRAFDRGTLLPTVLETLAAEARDADVDIAFVVRDRRAFAAAQAFRRRDPSRYWPSLRENLVEIADGLAERAAAGSLVAFFGAGVSRAAGLPSWDGLLAHLAADAGIDGQVAGELAELPLVDQALILEKRLGGPSALRERIAELVGGDAYTLAHALLASLPATEFVTTNYDELFELGASAAGMPVVRLPYESVTSGSQRWLLKLHGTIGAPSDIVLTREDYLRYPDRRGALAALVQALLDHPAHALRRVLAR